MAYKASELTRIIKSRKRQSLCKVGLEVGGMLSGMLLACRTHGADGWAHVTQEPGASRRGCALGSSVPWCPTPLPAAKAEMEVLQSFKDIHSG